MLAGLSLGSGVRDAGGEGLENPIVCCMADVSGISQPCSGELMSTEGCTAVKEDSERSYDTGIFFKKRPDDLRSRFIEVNVIVRKLMLQLCVG